MKPSTRSSLGAACEPGRSSVGDGSSVKARPFVQNQRLLPGSRSGQPRDQGGRFIKGGARVVESGPVRVRQQLVEADLVAALPLEQQVLADDDVVSGDGDEVSGNESEGNSFVSSSGDSESGKEEAGVLEELQGRGSSQAFVAAGSLADHLFDEMPQSVQGPGECFLGGATSVGTSSRSPHGAALEFVGGEPKGKAKFAEVGTESVVNGGRNSALDKGCPSVPGVLLGAGGNGRFQERDKGAALKAPWVNLFGDNRNLGAGIKLDEWEVDGDLVMLEDNDVDVVDEAWGYCLVGLFAGKCPGWTAVRKLREGWKVNCSHWRHRSGWFVFKFQSEEDRRKVLEGGPYFAYGCNLILKSMPRCFRFEGEDVSSVPIWIKLPGLPLDCWNARALGKIVSKVGKPISTDKLTLSKERISFARVLVEVAPYEKSKFLGSRGSMVARLKLKGIDGRAPPGVEPAA